VKVYDADGNLEATGSSVTVAQDQFVAVNFTNLNPGEPVISGFVTNGGAAGVAGVTVELCNVAQHLVATRTTSASGPTRSASRRQDSTPSRWFRRRVRGAAAGRSKSRCSTRRGRLLSLENQ